MKIPKIIHYCWFGDKDLPPLNKACIETWKEHLPDYKLVLWNETNSPVNNFIKHHLTEKNWAFVSDYVRLYALYTEGGIYLDTDFEVIKPFDALLDTNGFLAYQDSLYVNNAIAGSSKGNIFFKDCMDYMIRRHENGDDFHISPIVTTNVLASNQYQLKIYESQYFYPYNPYDPDKKIKTMMYNMITTDTYAIHHWAKSWNIEHKEKRIKQTMVDLFLDVSIRKVYFLIKNIIST